jgi:hypothetical protein
MTEKRAVQVSMDFESRGENVYAVSASAELGGVPTGVVCDTLLGIMEELIFHEVAEMPSVQELLSFSPVMAQDGTPYPLEDRTKRLVTKLLAHQMMLSRVAGRKYVTGGTSARLALPYSD